MVLLSTILDRITRTTSTIVLMLLLNTSAPIAHGQTLVDLSLTGPSAVVERQSAQYRATARFDDDSEFEVTLLSDWSVKPDDHASISVFGMLSTVEVLADEQVLVTADFTWDDIALEASMDVTIVDLLPKEGIDPWPFWGRTSTRLGRTGTIGPHTNTVDWFVQVDFHLGEQIIESSAVMDRYGRVFVGTAQGTTAVDTRTREVLWSVTEFGNVNAAPAVWGGYVVWGDVSPTSTIYSYDAATGTEIWTLPTEGGIISSPVVSPEGVVYVVDNGGETVYALRIEDGQEVWKTPLSDTAFNSPSLSVPGLLVTAGEPLSSFLVGLHPDDGSWLWSANAGLEIFGVAPIHNGRIFVASRDWNLYCFDAVTGEEDWRLGPVSTMRGGVAIGHDDTIYAVTGGGVGIGRLLAVTPDGELLWEYFHLSSALNGPIVSGDGIIYLCSQFADLRQGRVHALRPDGSELWIKDMPDEVSASPMLAPDGTLYMVCRDKNLYAFRDPAGDLNHDQTIDLADFSTIDQCLTRPRIWGEASLNIPGCELLDFNSDWDVDLHDYAAFQNSLGTIIETN